MFYKIDYWYFFHDGFNWWNILGLQQTIKLTDIEKLCSSSHKVYLFCCLATPSGIFAVGVFLSVQWEEGHASSIHHYFIHFG